MKHIAGLFSAFFLLSFTALGQVFWTEDFGAGACNQGQLATDYITGSNGAWTITQTGVNENIANVWYVSAQEQGGQGGGNCSIDCGGDMNNTLHIGNVFIDLPTPLQDIDADNGASYAATGGNLPGSSAATDVRVESPTIDCSGKSNISIDFVYMEGLNGDDLDPLEDNAEVWYFDGATWALLDDPAKTPNTCAPQGTWTAYTFNLPASADNNANVKIGFRWINDDDLDATDPSFAVDDITLSTPAVNNPVASFSDLPNTLCAGDSILVINDQSTSQGTITTWTWTFDGGMANLTDPANPTNVFWSDLQVGEHIVSLTVTDEFGTSEPYNDTVTVVDCSPVSSFTISESQICMGDSISFIDNSTFQGDAASITWSWTFGNGNTSADQNPGFETFANQGNYDIQLVASDNYGSDTSVVSLAVLDCSVANAFFTTSDTTNLCPGSTVTYTDASIPSAGAIINDWQWTFDGGTPATFNGQMPGAITYDNAGSYTTTLIVTDDLTGASTPYIQNITVGSCLGDAVIIVPDTSICPNDSILITDGSTGINITDWSWTFNGGTPQSSNLQNPGYIHFGGSGDYSVVLTITDNSGTNTDSLTIHVNAQPNITLTASETSICNEQSVTLVATGVDVTPSWSDNIQDGIPFVPTLGVHTYTGTVTNTVTGCSSSQDITITVQDCVAPIALFGVSDNEICIGDCVDFSDFSSNADTLHWDFGEFANPSTYTSFPGENVNVCFDSSGTYSISLLAVNNFGTDTDVSDIVVNVPPTLVIPNDLFSVDYGNSVTLTANSFDNVSYLWSPQQTIDNPISQSPQVTPDEETVYTVTITDENNCTASADLTVQVIFTIGLGIPNVFSPEAAAPNNTFGPLGYGFTVHQFVVYNKYGQKVFEAQEAGVLWDGTMDGKRLNAGTFYWSLDYEFEGETRKLTNGRVSLIH